MATKISVWSMLVVSTLSTLGLWSTTTTTTSRVRSCHAWQVPNYVRSSSSSSSIPHGARTSLRHHDATIVSSPRRARRRVRLFISADEIIANARAKTGINGRNDGPASTPSSALFSEELLEDMRESLLTLEKRVQEGIGALSVMDVEVLDQRLQRILLEMRLNQHLKPSPPSRPSSTAMTPTTSSSVSRPISDAEMMVPAKQASSAETTEEDGPAYEGIGGMGQPKGTVNTYIIDGMDEMDSEEYRLALQNSLIDRQRARRAAESIVGNQKTWNYLNDLSGDRGAFKAKEESSQNENNEDEPKSKPKSYSPFGKGGPR